jgi:hypothetical protein
MSFNPYEAPAPRPQDLTPAVGILSGTRQDLRSVAMYQRGIMACILLYFIAFVTQSIVFRSRGDEIPLWVGMIAALAGLGSALAGAVFVFLLSIKVYGPALGIRLGILTLIPCLGLLALLRVNAKATTVLQQNGIKVGLLGANPATISL